MQLSLCLISSIIAYTFGFSFIFSFPSRPFHFLPFSLFLFVKKLSSLPNLNRKTSELQIGSREGGEASLVEHLPSVKVWAELGMCLALESLRELLCLKHRAGGAILGSGSLCWGRPYPKKQWMLPLLKACQGRRGKSIHTIWLPLENKTPSSHYEMGIYFLGKGLHSEENPGID